MACEASPNIIFFPLYCHGKHFMVPRGPVGFFKKSSVRLGINSNASGNSSKKKL